jgi:hypothetical protein
MQTEADEKLKEAKEQMQKAIESLAGILIDNCHGTRDFKESYKSTLLRTMTTLIELKNSTFT